MRSMVMLPHKFPLICSSEKTITPFLKVNTVFAEIVVCCEQQGREKSLKT